jgi:hypothetical protein
VTKEHRIYCTKGIFSKVGDMVKELRLSFNWEIMLVIVTKTHTDEGEYNGEWYFSLRHGLGILKYSDGTVYQGHFHHDEKVFT